MKLLCGYEIGDIVEENVSQIADGWLTNNSPEIATELCRVFEETFDRFAVVVYFPVAYCSSQIIVGKNHAFFCNAQVV